MTLTIHELVSALIRYIHSLTHERGIPPAHTEKADDGGGDLPPDPPYWTYFIDNPISKDPK